MIFTCVLSAAVGIEIIPTELAVMDAWPLLCFGVLSTLAFAAVALAWKNRTQEATLRNQGDHLRLVLEATRSGVWQLDVETSRMEWSAEHNRILDLPPNLRDGSYPQWQERIHPEDRAAMGAEPLATLLQGRDAPIEFRTVHRDGSMRWVLCTGRVLHDERGKATRLLGIVRDITEHKEAESVLRENERRFRLANLHAPYPVMLHTADGEVLQVNDAWTHQTGYPADELKTLEDWIVRAYPSPAAQVEPRRLAAELPDHFGTLSRRGCRVRSANGEDQVWDMSSSILGLTPAGKILRITTATDVTEQQRREAALRDAKEEAEQASRAKTQFVFRLAEKLRSPLDAILDSVPALENNAPDEVAFRAVGHIHKNGCHLLALADELLDLARMEAGELDLRLESVTFGELVSACLDAMEGFADVRGVICAVQESPLFQAAVHADEARARQAVSHLLSNAIRYSHPGGRVTLDCVAGNAERPRLLVTDTGSGISPENMDRLFVPFERLGQELGPVEGAGLGLAVARQLIEAMGGGLGASSLPGQGSTFWVELPLAVDPATLPPEEDPMPAIPFGEMEDSVAATILYIEDNPSSQQVLRAILKQVRPQWQFLAAEDGAAGLEQASRHQPGVVLLDLQLPGMKGDAVLNALRANPETSGLSVVMLSADVSTRSRDRLLALGADAYLPKPFNVDDLLQITDGLLRMRRFSAVNQDDQQRIIPP